ncbi:uncharacterized protein LOC107041913 [Diachasma alloeum]|uniref:uncharacterized protein LOC107041913 n=1 Tax=Diachasma alloeum TaxID=454923 RepID=UPI0007382C39|nr:uncharacterized protein LOC107041913 [Diachasma alloeum]
MTAVEFCEKFEEVIRTYENSADATPSSDEEKRDAFNNAIMGSVPMVQYLQSSAKLRGEQPPTYEQLKLVVMQKEALRKQSGERSSEVRAANLTGFKERCFKCRDYGHLGRNCPGKGKGKMCYSCKGYGHIIKDCPNSGKKNNKP